MSPIEAGRFGESAQCQRDITLAREGLDWKPKVALEDELKESTRYLQKRLRASYKFPVTTSVGAGQPGDELGFIRIERLGSGQRLAMEVCLKISSGTQPL